LPLACFSRMGLPVFTDLWTRDLRAEKTPSGTSSWSSPFDRFPYRVAVVTGVSQYIPRLPGKPLQFVQASFLFGTAGRIDRSQQRPQYPAFSRGNNHFIGVSKDPAIVLAVSPGSILVNTTPGFSLPRGTSATACRHQTFVHCNRPGIRPSMPDGLHSNLLNHHLQQMGNRASTHVKLGSRQQPLTGKVSLELSRAMLPECILGVTRLFPMHDANHHHGRD